MRQSWLNSTAVTVAAAGPRLNRLISPRVSPGPICASRARVPSSCLAWTSSFPLMTTKHLGLHRAFLDDHIARMAGKKFAVGTEQFAVIVLEVTDPAKRGQGGLR